MRNLSAYFQITYGVVQTDGDNSSQLRDIVPIHISGDMSHLFDLQGEAVLKSRRHHLV
ncbi:hypothetical protein [Microcoleus sp. S13_C5]|uniref:hypothetical protein n=1 Tax=Microcoleus sp. S13_C5 TaxID=3055411 RepID=UPI002FD350D8